MVCDLRLRQGQTPVQRKEEIREAVQRLSQGLANGSIKAVVGQQGAIAFNGFAEEERAGVSDACAFRELMVSGSALAKVALMQAEALAGRRVDMQVVNAGVHSHDGGKTWGQH